MWNTDENGLILRKSALDSGYTDNDIRQGIRTGEIVTAFRGAYIPNADLPETHWQREQEIYRRRCLAAGAVSDAPLSHESAAAIHGLAMLKPDLRRVHSSVPRESSGKCRVTRHTHTGLDMHDVVVVDGVLVTDLVTTAVDVALSCDFARALAVFDSALRMGVDRDELELKLNSRRRRGSVRARQALRHASGLADNPGESWSRAQLIQAGFPTAYLQRPVEVQGVVYFSDFDWEGKVIGEFDGEGKYLAQRRPGQSIADAVMREKDRESALRDLGYDIARWDWPVLEARGVADRVRPHLKAAGLL